MERSTRASILLGIGLALAAALARGQPPPQENPPFVPGQVIVKLTADGAGGQALAQADRDHLETDTGLAQYLATLSRELTVPLRIERLTSGGELVLAIDLEKLRDELLARLRSDPQVENARDRKITPETGLVELGVEALVQLKTGSEAAATVQAAHAQGLKTSPQCQALARDLVAIQDYQPEIRISGSSEIVLGIDLRDLTKDLVKRLRERPEVEHAQLNILLQTFR